MTVILPLQPVQGAFTGCPGVPCKLLSTWPRSPNPTDPPHGVLWLTVSSLTFVVTDGSSFLLLINYHSQGWLSTNRTRLFLLQTQSSNSLIFSVPCNSASPQLCFTFSCLRITTQCRHTEKKSKATYCRWVWLDFLLGKLSHIFEYWNK